MREITNKRKERILSVLKRRQKDLTLVLNNIHDPHNVSAILRSCDAFSVFQVQLLYNSQPFPSLGHKSSASAKKWLEIKRYTESQELMQDLRSQRMQTLTAGFGPKAVPVYDWDLTLPTAIILGNEHSGVEQEVISQASGEIYIPMQGMVQSLNVSVAAAIILYEAWRQRLSKNTLEAHSLDPEEIESMYQTWSKR